MKARIWAGLKTSMYSPNPKRGLGGVGVAVSDLSGLSSPTLWVSSVLGNCGAQVSTTLLRPSNPILRSSAKRTAWAASRTWRNKMSPKWTRQDYEDYKIVMCRDRVNSRKSETCREGIPFPASTSFPRPRASYFRLACFRAVPTIQDPGTG